MSGVRDRNLTLVTQILAIPSVNGYSLPIITKIFHFKTPSPKMDNIAIVTPTVVEHCVFFKDDDL